MNKTVPLFACICLLLSGCGAPVAAPLHEPIVTTGAHKTENHAVRFFAHEFDAPITVALKPDPFVQRAFPDVLAPTQSVTVYLPEYPGANRVSSPNDQIGDMGSSMTPDLVDGTVYYSSRDTEAEILSWYTSQLQRIGYRQVGHGSNSVKGKIVSHYYRYTKNADLGDPTDTPSIDIGFTQQGNATLFKLKVNYVITPPRPNDSFLPATIQKVVLSDNQKSKVVTDKGWIRTVTTQVNSLQMAILGRYSHPAVGVQPGQIPPSNVTAVFYDASGGTMSVQFTYPTGGFEVRVGKDAILRSTEALNAAIRAQFDTP